jgi:uncharacterized protein Yka (UPF0111/DUF47 family)
MAFRLLPREDEYFTFFSQMTAKMQEASTALVELTQGPPENFEAVVKKIKDAEHNCDAITHEITTK